jgi:hypothetical protein
MSQTSGFGCRLFVAGCMALFLAGCGGVKGVKVEGKLLNNGQAYVPPAGVKVNLSFLSTDPKGGASAHAAVINPGDGSFVVSGPKDAGMPPGKYKINLNLTSEATDPASLEKATWANAALAQIHGKECDIPAGGKATITIDIGKGTVSQ